MTHDEERLNWLCLIGLIIIAAILVVGILILSAMKLPVSDALIVMASGITGAMCGFIGAHAKKAPAASVDAGEATVNVAVPVEPNEDAKP